MSLQQCTLADLRGRYTYRTSLVPVGLDDQLILAADSRRVAVMFSDLGGALDINVYPERQIALAAGFLVPAAGAQPLEIWFPRHGPLSFCEWRGVSAGGLDSVYCVEILYE